MYVPVLDSYRMIFMACVIMFAVDGEDFVFAGPFVFVFAAGSSNISCVSIGIIDDDNFEGDHSFTVRLSETHGSPILKRTVGFSSPFGPLIGPDNETVVVINDPEGMSLVTCML